MSTARVPGGSGRVEDPAAASARPARRRRWRRWVLAGVAVVLVLVVVAVAAYVNFSSLPRLTLPSTAAAAPVGSLDGTWDVAEGSEAGFRIQQTVFGMSGDVVGRTDRLTGTVVISGGEVTSAVITVDLAGVTANGKPQPQFALSLGIRDYPSATLTLTQPVALGQAFISGSPVDLTAAALLDMHGASHPVAVTLAARRDGSALEAAGSAPVALADWGIRGLDGFGPIASLADHGVAEFLLVLHRQANPG